MAENTKIVHPFNAWGFVEGKKFISQPEQRNAKWVEDAQDAEGVGLNATAQEVYKGKEAPTTNLYNICAIECPSCEGKEDGSDSSEG